MQAKLNPTPPRILVVSAGSNRNWKWYSARSENLKFAWEFHSIPQDSSYLRILAAAFIGRRLGKYDIVISQEYFITFGIALRCFLSGGSTKHIAFGFNQSRRLMKTRSKILNAVINRIFANVSLFVTHSVIEQDHFFKLHCIPKSKFHFTHWTLDLPKPPGENPQEAPPCICMIGRNNRDWKTFIDMAKLVDIKCIAVTDGADLGDVPENVKILVNLPMQDCIKLIRSAKINLVLLKDDSRGAGHITSVIAMSAGIPQIVTQSNSLREYFIDDLHGFGAIPKNPEDVACKVTRLISDRKLHADMSLNAANYAKRWFSEDYGSLRLSAIVEAVLYNQELGAIDPQWHAQFIADLERANQITARVAQDQAANA